MTASRTWLLLPALILAAVVALLLWWRPLDKLASGVPPVEEATIESVQLTPGLISLRLRTDGSEPVVVAQVQVDGAYRTFTADPERPGTRLAVTRIDIPYPWISGEAHHIALVTGTGAVFEHTIDVAQLTPEITGASLWMLIAVGTLLGVVPVAIGLLSWPAMRSISPKALNFVLALTVGFLVFLLIDTIGEGLEKASETIARLRGQALFWAIFAVTAVGLLTLGRRSGKAPEGFALAYFIALGIGLHNLGEGLAVGAALASGAAALATFLVIGFTIHNVTEGIGIAAPVAREKPSLVQFAQLAATAGLPAIVGTVTGTQAVSPLWITVCFAIGAGAILQVIVEVTALVMRNTGSGNWFDPALASGLCSGLAIMYVTALLV